MAEDIVRRVKDEWLDWQQYYRNDHRRIGEDLKFALEHDHYYDDDQTTKDKRRIKPKVVALFNMERHKGSKIMKAANHFDVRPEDKEADPGAAEVWNKRIALWRNDPKNVVRESFANICMGALPTGAWASHWKWHPIAGAVLDSQDPRFVYWHPGFNAPYHPMNPAVHVEVQMPVAAIEAMGRLPKEQGGWSNTRDLVPDNGTEVPEGANRADGRINFNNGAGPIGPSDTQEPFVTVLFSYYRFENQTQTVVGNVGREIPPGAQYAKCESCGWQSPPQAEMMAPLPPMMPCPTCGGPALLQTLEFPTYQEMLYRKGQRMVITAPLTSGGRLFYDGPWWFESRTNMFPVDLWKPYYHPTKPLPPGDTFYYRSLVLVMDCLLRMGYEGIQRSKGLIIAPDDGIHDAFGEPFAFSDFQDVAYYDRMAGPNAINYFGPPGIPSGLPVFMNMMLGEFERNKGTGDIGLTPGESKDIAVGTIRQLVESGEVPVDDHIASWQAFLSRIVTVGVDIWKSTDPPDMLATLLGPNRAAQMGGVIMGDVPSKDIIATAEPTLAQEDMDTALKLQQLINAPPPMVPLLAKAANLPPSWVSELQGAMNQMQMQAEQQAQMQAQAQQLQAMQQGGPQMNGNNPAMVAG